nr:purine-nucleoside phosphorylase [Actinomyces sp.]
MTTTDPTLLEALTVSGGIAGPGPALEAAHQIMRRTGADRHDLLVVLGSGADGALEGWGEPEARLALSDLPGVLAPVAPGHRDLLASYRRVLPGDDGECGLRVLVAYGRTHLYEGHGPVPVVALARAAAATGVRAAVLVNANGCLRGWRLGEVMTITDHLNLTGSSPFDGTVFTDVREVWDRGLAQVLRERTEREGTYAALRGPEYQTMAETRWLAGGGADVVGMSTVLEAVALHQLGVRVAGMSVVSDLSFAAEATDPQEVVRLVCGAHRTLADGVDAVVAELARS